MERNFEDVKILLSAATQKPKENDQLGQDLVKTLQMAM